MDMGKFYPSILFPPGAILPQSDFPGGGILCGGNSMLQHRMLKKYANYTKQKKQYQILLVSSNEKKLSKKNVVSMWNYLVIKPRLSPEIVSGNDANEQRWILWRHVKIKNCK